MFLSFDVPKEYKHLRLKLFINEDEFLMGMDLSNYITLDLAKTAWVKVTYKQKTTFRLSAPYPTDCKSYREFGFDNHEQYMQHCFLNTYRDNGSIPHFVVLQPNSTFTVLSAKSK